MSLERRCLCLRLFLKTCRERSAKPRDEVT